MIELTPLEYLQGALTLAFVIISFILGFIIMAKYIKYKNRQFLLVGATWIFLVSPYWPDAMSFILIITTGSEINTAAYFFIATVFVPPLYITWGIVVTDFLYKEKQKLIVGIFTCITVVWETIVLIMYFIDYNLIGTKKGPFIVQYNDIIVAFLMGSIVLFLITGLLLVRQSFKSTNKEIILKGKFLLLAYIVFTVGTMIDVIFADTPTELTIFLAPILVIIAAFCFYCGFTLPKFIKNLLLKE